MRSALLQVTSSDDPDANCAMLVARIRAAAAEGAGFVLTPEVCNCVSTSRSHQHSVLRPEAEDRTLAALRDLAAELGLWILIGSLALKTDDPQGRFANRSFVLDPTGAIVGRYDKIHMFDVELGNGESYRESAGFRPGDRLCTVPTPFGVLGLSICYDLRFPHLYRALAQAGAEILAIPAAFSPTTGAAHWQPLLQARAIETGSYVLAPAQTGYHKTTKGPDRETYGHTMAIDPWGSIVADLASGQNTVMLDIDSSQSIKSRRRVPSLVHDRIFKGP